MLRPVTALALALYALCPVVAAADDKPIVDMVEKVSCDALCDAVTGELARLRAARDMSI